MEEDTKQILIDLLTSYTRLMIRLISEDEQKLKESGFENIADIYEELKAIRRELEGETDET